MSNPTPTYLLIEDRLGAPLADYIAERRARKSSWHRIAAELHKQTDVIVTAETIRNWGTVSTESAA